MSEEKLLEFMPCRRCASDEKSSRPEGYLYVSLLNGQQGLQECNCHRQWREKAELLHRAKKASLWYDDISLRYLPSQNYVGKNSYCNVQKLYDFLANLDNIKYRSASLYLYGPYGTQKTTLSQWLGRSILLKGYSVRYVTMQQLISELSSAFDSDEAKQRNVENLLSVDFLIIDEAFTKSKVVLYKSGYQLPFLETFLKERMDLRKKSCIFVSNTFVRDIASQGFGESIQNFIDRSITSKKTDLEFLDVYMQERSNALIDSDALFN